jgi:pyruvate, water dikinase
MVSDSGAYVVWLETLSMRDIERVGGKNASLGEMIHHLKDAGVQVPGGFATTADAYREFLAHESLDRRIEEWLKALDVDDTRALAETGRRIRQAVSEAPFPDALERDIRAAYEKLTNGGQGEASFAVRSSATAEDLPDASFAGQQETFLNVRGIEHVLARVKDVFASLFNDRAIAYRVHHGFEHAAVALSAGVQKMVRSDLAASGVMFTMDTESGFRDAIFITASYGLGEAVVQGAVNPDEFYVYKPALEAGRPAILRRGLGEKARKMVYASGNGKAVEFTPVPEADRLKFCLSDKDVLALARQALVIEKHYGRPMDIEWGKDGATGELFMLQARPETVKSRGAANTLRRYRLKGKGEALITGRAIGQKIGAGHVRILRNIDEMHRVREGDVLVTDMTDPDWEPVMKRASAIVTNRGGRTCFSGDTRLLTNVGFVTFHDMARWGHEGISVPSLNRDTLKIEWKPVLEIMKRTAPLLRIGVSQTGRMEGNDLKLTRDHRMLNLAGAELVDTEIQDVLARQECVLLAQHLPQLSSSSQKEQSLAYLLGGLMTDGHVHLSRTHGEVTFIQKPEVAKLNFIARMNEALQQNYGKSFKASAKLASSGLIRGQRVVGQANAYRCYSKTIATAVRQEQDTIVMTLLKGDVALACHFLAGVIDGDGSYARGRVNVYVGDPDLLEAVVVACLRIGTLPHVSVNRTIYNVQIVEKLDLIGRHTQRLACRDERGVGSRFFNARQLLTDTVNSDINNRVRKNLLIDAGGLQEHLPAISEPARKARVEKLLASDVRQARVALKEALDAEEVYTLTVADNHNYIVFTERYTPVLVNNCHAAIIARELGIPAVVGCGDATTKLADGAEVTVSCAEGDTGNVYKGHIDFAVDELALDKMPDVPVKIMMNVGNPDQAFDFAALPHRGVGLARLEFIVNKQIGIHPQALLELDKQTPEVRKQIDRMIAPYGDPIEYFVKRLAEGISTIAAAFAPQPVIVRLSDFKSNEYANLIGGRRYEPHEENPMLGFRGASRYIADSFRPCFDLECRALKLVRNEMGLANVQVMVPFVRTVGEAKRVVEILAENGLARGDDDLKVIMMCELPSNAVLAEAFLEHFDGFSIGSNDMTQLTLGLDRDSGVVAGAFDERDPAVKYMLELAIKACRKHGKYIGICGQGPSDHPDLAQWLLKQGIDSISLNPDTVVETWLYLSKKGIGVRS